MRFERLTANKIKIFITSNDLFERGLSKEDIWKDSIKWNQLFHDMLDEASEEFDVEIHGSVAVEIFSLQAQGMIMIITVDEVLDDEEIHYDGYIEMQVRVEGCDDLLYEFENFEDIINLSKTLNTFNISGGSLYFLNNRYFFLMNNLDPSNNERITSVLSEYGSVSIHSPYILEEYGNKIINGNAVETLLNYFR